MAAGPRPHRRFTTLLLLTITLVPSAGTVLGHLGRYGWTFDLLSHFRLQYAVVLLALTAATFLTKRWKTGTLCAALLAVNLASVLPLYHPMRKPSLDLFEDSSLESMSGRDPNRLVLLHFNLGPQNRQYEQVSEYLRESGADAIFLQQVTPAWEERLPGLMAPYRPVQIAAREDPFGMALLVPFRSRLLDSELFTPLAESTIPAIRASFELEGGPVQTLYVHAPPPIDAGAWVRRNRHLQAAAFWAAEQGESAVVLGDLNCTPFSPFFEDLLSMGRLISSQDGYGVSSTWPAYGGPLGMLPIDHLLHSGDLKTVRRALGPSLGSDHRPLVVELSRPRR